MKIICWIFGHTYRHYYMVKATNEPGPVSHFKIDFNKCTRCGFEPKYHRKDL